MWIWTIFFRKIFWIFFLKEFIYVPIIWTNFFRDDQGSGHVMTIFFNKVYEGNRTFSNNCFSRKSKGMWTHLINFWEERGLILTIFQISPGLFCQREREYKKSLFWGSPGPVVVLFHGMEALFEEIRQIFKMFRGGPIHVYNF